MAGNNYPIILAHGIARFDILTNALFKRLNLCFWERSRSLSQLHYFKGIMPFLRRHGFEAYTTGVSFAADVNVRARDLRGEVEHVLAASGQGKVHIIGHSMGGLDARAMIVDEGMADSVASMTSIGTPHLGTSFADWGLSHGGHEIIKAANQIVDLQGFENLTLAARAEFNEHARHEEAENSVVYQAYAATQALDQVFTLIRDSWKIINEREGANDGLVSRTSQLWRSELVSDDGRVKKIRQEDFPFPADHLNQTGWWDLSELKRVRWWHIGLWRKKVAFETAVKQVYLQIAREVSALPA